MIHPEYEPPIADPAMVGQLMAAIRLAIEQTSIPEVTTTADVLSALFTTLDHALRVAKEDADPQDAAYNAAEINRVLMDFMMEFGNVTTH
jgi:hypothetical protein